MVERLKIAVEKARARRALADKIRHSAGAGAPPQAVPEIPVEPVAPTPPPPAPPAAPPSAAPVAPPAAPAPAPEPPLMLGSAEAPLAPPAPESSVALAPTERDLRRAAAWNGLGQIELSPRHLEKNRLIAHARTDPAHVAIDVLRTRMLSALARKGWRRVGITSPNAACGKTFMAANLAISLARQAQCRTVLIDMDMRQPSLARVLGVQQQEALRWFLEGEIPASKFLMRVGANLALGLNSKRMRDAGEMIQAPATAHALRTMQAQLDPDVVLYDLPPMLSGDDVTGFLPNLDCVLLVIGGGLTRPSEVTECERLLEEHHCPLLGVVLNKGEGVNIKRYAYD